MPEYLIRNPATGREEWVRLSALPPASRKEVEDFGGLEGVSQRPTPEESALYATSNSGPAAQEAYKAGIRARTAVNNAAQLGLTPEEYATRYAGGLGQQEYAQSTSLPPITPPNPYAAFQAAFKETFGKAATQTELNNAEEDGFPLNKLLKKRPHLTRALPLDRQMSLPSDLIAEMSNQDVQKLVEFNPQVAGGFPTSYWKNFDNDWLTKTLGPFFEENNPGEWSNIVEQNQIGGAAAGGLPPALRPSEGISRVGPTGGSYAGQPSPGTTASVGLSPQLPGRPSERPPRRLPFPELQTPEYRPTGDPYQDYLGLSGATPASREGISRIQPMMQEGAAYAGGRPLSRLLGVSGPEGEERTDRPEPSLPPARPLQPGFTLNPNYPPEGYPSDTPPNMREPQYILDPTYQRPGQGAQPSTSILIGREGLQEKNQAQIDRLEQQMETARQSAELAERRQQFGEAKHWQQQEQQLQQQVAQLGQRTREFDVGTQEAQAERQLRSDMARGYTQGEPTLQREMAVGQESRANAQLLADRANQAAQIALRRGDQQEAAYQFDKSDQYRRQALGEETRRFDVGQQLREREFGLTEELGRGRLGLERSQFQFQAQRDPSSAVQRTFALRGQTAPEEGLRTTLPPLTSGEVFNSPFTAPGLKSAFSGQSLASSQSPLPALSPQGEARLYPSEREELGATVRAMGMNPEDYQERRRRLFALPRASGQGYTGAARYAR